MNLKKLVTVPYLVSVLLGVPFVVLYISDKYVFEAFNKLDYLIKAAIWLDIVLSFCRTMHILYLLAKYFTTGLLNRRDND